MILLVLYSVILLGVGIWDRHTGHRFETYVLAGRNHGTVFVASGLLATALGASATMGVMQLAWQVGFPAFWWLGVGAIGFVVQASFLSKKLFQCKVFTLPELAQRLLGKEAKIALAIMISIGWLGIISAQFVAAAKIVEVVGGISWNLSLLGVATVICAYTWLGGNAAIVKTDVVQFAILAVVVIFCLFYLLSAHPVPLAVFRPAFINSQFPFSKWLYFLLIVGAGYVICPILYSRVFAAKSAQVARRSLFHAAGWLAFLGVSITAIGIWAQYYIPYTPGTDVFSLILNQWLPPWMSTLLIVGILSAIVSSADTCLIVIATILEQDILHQKRVRGVRTTLLFIGFTAYLLAGWKQEILPLLLISYAIFSAGAVPPISVFLFGNKTAMSNDKKIILLAFIIGGGLGLVGSILEKEWVVLSGFFISLLLSLMVFFRKKENVPS